MGDIVIHKLPELHEKERVLRVQVVAAGRQHVADHPGRRQLKPVFGPLPRNVQGSGSVGREHDPLERSSGPTEVRVLEIITGSVDASKPPGRITDRSRQPGTFVPNRSTRENI